MMSRCLDWLQAERSRWVLWLPVLLGAGMGLYFSLKFEPSGWSLLAVAALVAPWHYARRKGLVYAPLLALVLTVMTGFAWAKLMSDWRPVTMLKKEMNFAEIKGRIIEIGDVEGGWRVTLDRVSIAGLEPQDTPQKVRLKLQGRSAGEGFMTGDVISLRGGLLPPAGPVMPQAFDFARYFYFRDIGGVGYGIPPVTKLAGDKGESGLWLTQMRAYLTARIRSHMKPVEGAIAAALITGERTAIPDDVNKDMQVTNLSHLLSISGLHMAMVTGMVFFLVRYGLLIFPPTQHWRHAKATGAWVALLFGGAYLLVSGLPVPAVRAYVMVALMLVAVLIRREVVPIRSIAWAAVLLLLYDPPNLLEPGFQLSFGATLALIAWYEYLRSLAGEPLFASRRLRRVLLYFGGALMTSFVAETATLPLVLYHFNNISFMGMLANLLVTPLVSLMMMPGVLMTFVLMPFGLEGLALQWMEWGITGMLWIARVIAELPYANIYALAPPRWGLVLMTLGALWLMLWERKPRLLGLVLVVAGAVSIITVSTPDLLISKDGKQIAARIDGTLTLLKGRPNSFVPQQWAYRSGVESLPVLKANAGDALRCDRLGCIAQTDHGTLALVREQAALAEDCYRAERVIAPFILWPEECPAADRIDRRRMQRAGGLWMWLNEEEPRIGTSQGEQGNRPWTRR